MKTHQFDFTREQAVDITRYLWKSAHEPFIQTFADTLQEKGFDWLTNKHIDSDEAEWIVDYLNTLEQNK